MTFEKLKQIAIYGAGGFGRETACLLNIINEHSKEWELIGFFDDNPLLKGKMISHYGPCLGGIDDLNVFPAELSVVITVANPLSVKKLVEKIVNPLVLFPNIIHPDLTVVDPITFKIGKGNIIQGKCAMSCDVTLGDFNILNGSDVMGHDVRVGNFNSFMPNIRVSGGVTIEDCNSFGVGSIILQGIKIGNNIKLGAGSVLITNPKDGFLYMGNPAKKTVF